jgi:threonine synthase
VLTHLECALCGKTHPWQELQNVCKECGRPLFARYLIAPEQAASFKRSLPEQSSTVWRYREMLPVPTDQEILTLGEGGTPFLPAPHLAAHCGSHRLWIKDESQNPTGSFKARGMAVAVAMAKYLGPKNWRRLPLVMRPQRSQHMRPEPVFLRISLCRRTPRAPTLSSAK